MRSVYAADAGAVMERLRPAGEERAMAGAAAGAAAAVVVAAAAATEGASFRT